MIKLLKNLGKRGYILSLARIKNARLYVTSNCISSNRRKSDV